MVFAPTVTTANDSGPGSLRQAIADASPTATILFDPSLSGATILLTNGLTLDKSISIDASALPGGIAIDGNAASRVFEVSTGTTNVLTALTLTNGYAGGVNYPTYGGGGIFNLGHLTLDRCTLEGNSAGQYGGGIFNASGTVTLANCSLVDNSTEGSAGGGIYNASGTVTLTNCTLAGNSADGYGGGIYNHYGTVTLNASTLSSNSVTADAGGGIYSYTATITEPIG